MQLLSELLAEYGDIDREGSQELTDVAALTRTLGRKGTVVLKFVVEKQGDRVLLSVGTEAKPPKPDAQVHLWHVGPDGLTQDDPYQTRIDTETGELITPEHPRKD